MAGLTSLVADSDPVLDYLIEVEQGADYHRSIPVLGLSTGVTLAGWSVAGQIWSAEPPGTVLHDLDVSLFETDVQLTIPNAASAAWDWDLARYAVDLTDPYGKITRFMAGWVTVEHRPRASSRVVTREMLHRHMSEPRWTPAQEAEADRVVQAVERDLSAALYGAPITPVPRNEVVSVTREGMVSTSLPVAQLVSLNGSTIVTDPTTGAPTNLPAGYSLRDHWLWQSFAAGESWGGAFGVPWWNAPAGPTYTGAPYYTGYSVAVTYLGGWGAEPALVEAILRKAAVRMSGRHADTMVITGLNAQPANQASRETPDFTDQDMKSLGRFRNLGWGSQ